MDNSTNAECKAASPPPSADQTAALMAAPLQYASPGYEAGAGPNPNTGFGVLYNAMIYPFTVGPMAVSSFSEFLPPFF